MRAATDMVVLLVIVDAVVTLVPNTTITSIVHDKLEDTRRAGKRGRKDRSTSSSSGERSKHGSKSDSGSSRSSLELSDSGSSSDSDETKYTPNPDFNGWRKWHRTCVPCPEEMAMKWRDPAVEWICGAYQRARRSFKSICMMHYRNCQDGTMFVKIHDHRCANDTSGEKPHGEHFFYDYVARLSVESDSTSAESSDTSKDSSSSSSGE